MADSRPFQLDLVFSNPYKRTALFIKQGRAFFGLWRPPEVQLDGDEKRIRIQLGMEGQLDILAESQLGSREYWRAIAQVNKIDYPLEEVKVGDEIIIPKLSNVRAAYRRTEGVVAS